MNTFFLKNLPDDYFFCYIYRTIVRLYVKVKYQNKETFEFLRNENAQFSCNKPDQQNSRAHS